MELSREYLGRLASLHQILIFRNLKATYQDTWLGYAWTLVTPLIYAGILVFLFEQVLEIKMRRFSSYLLIGILAYRWFQSALSQGARSITSNRVLARRPGFDVAVLPIVPVTSNLLDFLLSLPILAIVLAIGGSELSSALLAIPILLLVQYILTLGFAYLLSAANLIFRDTSHVADLALTAGFFLTPIFYDIENVPESIRPLFYLNPLVPLMDGYRSALIDGQWPDVVPLLVVGIASLVVLVVGIKMFGKVIHKHIEEA
ncbi:MAG: ABC transporter permease [Gammaproteobacteria bacterium]